MYSMDVGMYIQSMRSISHYTLQGNLSNLESVQHRIKGGNNLRLYFKVVFL